MIVLPTTFCVNCSFFSCRLRLSFSLLFHLSHILLFPDLFLLTHLLRTRHGSIRHASHIGSITLKCFIESHLFSCMAFKRSIQHLGLSWFQPFFLCGLSPRCNWLWTWNWRWIVNLQKTCIYHYGNWKSYCCWVVSLYFNF